MAKSRRSWVSSPPSSAASPAGLYQRAPGSSAPATKAPPRAAGRTPRSGRNCPPAWAAAGTRSASATTALFIFASSAILDDGGELHETPFLVGEEAGDGGEDLLVIGGGHRLALVGEGLFAVDLGDAVDDLHERRSARDHLALEPRHQVRTTPLS